MIPFAIAVSLFSIFFSLVKTGVTLFIMILGFILNRGFGAVFGAVAGLLLGKKHLRVKMF
jgi:hypothetical protein